MQSVVSRESRNLISVAVTGSGGSGAVTAGQILLAAASKAGFYGFMTRSAGPQIRGGESAAMVRYGPNPVTCMGDSFDIVVGLDWRNIDRFVDEIPLDAHSLILTDPDSGETPTVLLSTGAKESPHPFKSHADSVENGRINMAAIGAVGAVTGLPQTAIESAIEEVLARKGRETVEAAIACVDRAYRTSTQRLPATAPVEQVPVRWNISGNEAGGLGAMRGGIRFVAAYPITPASEMLEWLAPNLEKAGGALLQAEDELASVNMIIGGSFGGVPSLTATSGPGLSLMMEGLGLAVASETPIVVANVMRGGPSTGIPTKSEQSDLNIALHGFHGDAPHLVLAAMDIRDCVFTTQWAVELAEHLQTVAIVLSDQSLGQSRAVIPPPQVFEGKLSRRLAEPTDNAEYQRYAVTENGISPMAIPGTEHGMYTADGLEHNPRGTPSSLSQDHLTQLDKRRKKIHNFDYGEHWAEIHGEGPLCLITWGSTSGAAFEAAERLGNRLGRPTKVIALRLIMPLDTKKLKHELSSCSSLLVVEQNQEAQLFHYLLSQQVLPENARAFARPGPLPVRPNEIISAVEQEA